MGDIANKDLAFINIPMTQFYIIVALILLFMICGLVLFILVLIDNKKLIRNYNEFFKGSDARSMEGVILKRFKDIDRLLAADAKKDVAISEINENLLLVTQKVGIVKYDAFKEMGGKLSFALAMLDKNNTGFVINAMHSREGCYTYIKEIIKGEAFIALGDEEKKAVDMAINSDNFEAV